MALEALRDIAGRAAQVFFFPSPMHTAKNMDAASWPWNVVAEVAMHTRKTGNHICRPDVCKDDRIGKRGFCRMHFWHWVGSVDSEEGLVAKMTYGGRLCPCCNGKGRPPVCTSPRFIGTLLRTCNYHLSEIFFIARWGEIVRFSCIAITRK